MDEIDQRQFIHFLAKQLKECGRELMAYQLFAHLLKKNGVLGVEEILNQSRNSPVLQAKFEKYFEGFDELLPPADPDQSEMVKELLSRWNPNGVLPN